MYIYDRSQTPQLFGKSFTLHKGNCEIIKTNSTLRSFIARFFLLQCVYHPGSRCQRFHIITYTLTSAHMIIPAIAVRIRVTASNGQDFKTESITTVSVVMSSSVVINSVPG